MRELSAQDIQDVNGGSEISEAVALFIAGLTVAQIAGIAGAGVVTAFVASPFAAVFAVGLFAAGGFRLGTAAPNVRIGPDVGGSAGKDTDC